MQPNEQQINEWKESQVTEELLRLVRQFSESLRTSHIDAYSPFEPQKTQEILAGINGALDTWEIVEDLLEGDWSYLDDSDTDEGTSGE
jgi:hypothetical protein